MHIYTCTHKINFFFKCKEKNTDKIPGTNEEQRILKIVLVSKETLGKA